MRLLRRVSDSSLSRFASSSPGPKRLLGVAALTLLSLALTHCSNSGGTATTVPNPTAAPTASPSPSSNPSSNPTATPSPRPSGSPSSSPTATPSPTAKPTATPTPSPTPTPKPSPTATPSPSPTPKPAPSGQIYVADFAKNSIFVYAANPSGTLNEAPLATIAGSNTGLSQPQGIAVDASGRIYVANDVANSGSAGILSAGGYITVYAANPSGTLNEAPLATITQAVAQTGDVLPGFPSAITLDSSGRIYLATGDYGAGGGGTVLVFPANPSGTTTQTPIGTINTVGFAFTGVALDAARRIYTANPYPQANAPAEVAVFAANPTGVVSGVPVATIVGSNTGEDNPIGISLDASGKVYVANFGDYAPGISSITVYAANPTGALNEAPLATIAGSNTALIHPTAVAIDATGKVYVGNAGASITVYAANPSGTLNEAPIATISGSNTGLTSPPNGLTGFGQPISLTVH
jgi:sugar lactone lactonase YvrE